MRHRRRPDFPILSLYRLSVDKVCELSEPIERQDRHDLFADSGERIPTHFAQRGASFSVHEIGGSGKRLPTRIAQFGCQFRRPSNRRQQTPASGPQAGVCEASTPAPRIARPIAVAAPTSP